MCQKAMYLEQHHLWVRGDYYAEKILDRWYVDVFIGNDHYSITTDGHPFIGWVWLPKQDQLQAMAGFRQGYAGCNVWHYCRKLAEFADKSEKWQIMGSSFEQLWLAFVMHEKFNKHWNGTTWEENNEND